MLIRNLALDKGECRKPCREGQNAIKYPIFVSIYYLSDRSTYDIFERKRKRERERNSFPPEWIKSLECYGTSSGLPHLRSHISRSASSSLWKFTWRHVYSYKNIIDICELKGGLPHARNVYI